MVGIDAHGVDVESQGARERITASTVLWAAGVAASPLIQTLGVPIDRAGRALVEPDLSIAGHPEVFVIGDASSFVHTRDGVPLPGVVQPATQGAAHAARTILRRMRGEPSTPFVYKDLGNMAIVGRASAIADLGWIRLSGLIGWLAWLFLHIAKLIGFRNRVVVLIEWARRLLHVSARSATDHGDDDEYVEAGLQTRLTGRSEDRPLHPLAQGRLTVSAPAFACATPSPVRTRGRGRARCLRPTEHR